MEKIKLRVTGNQIEVLERPAVITAGTVGLEAEFSFDSQWNALTKTVAVKAGDKVISAILAENACAIPWEVLEKPKQWLCIGVYGANREGTVVIPTLWAKISVIHTGTNPEGDPALEPTAPIWQEALTQAADGADAYRELRRATEDLAMELQLADESHVLGGILTELLSKDRYNEYMLYEHTDNQENPHGVTCEQIGAATKEELGDMETALDSILAIQNQLIGGVSV